MITNQKLAVQKVRRYNVYLVSGQLERGRAGRAALIISNTSTAYADVIDIAHSNSDMGVDRIQSPIARMFHKAKCI